jgi:hypothetical protein
MSDVAWIVNESVRAAVVTKRDAIDEIDLSLAMQRLTT